jgi:hypothetical protein
MFAAITEAVTEVVNEPAVQSVGINDVVWIAAIIAAMIIVLALIFRTPKFMIERCNDGGVSLRVGEDKGCQCSCKKPDDLNVKSKTTTEEE